VNVSTPMQLQFRPRTTLVTPDAIQAACALSLRGRTIFITGDASFLKVEGLEALIV